MGQNMRLWTLDLPIHYKGGDSQFINERTARVNLLVFLGIWQWFAMQWDWNWLCLVTWLFLCLLYHLQEGCNTLGYVSMFVLVLAVPRGNTVPKGWRFLSVLEWCVSPACVYTALRMRPWCSKSAHWEFGPTDLHNTSVYIALTCLEILHVWLHQSTPHLHVIFPIYALNFMLLQPFIAIQHKSYAEPRIT